MSFNGSFNNDFSNDEDPAAEFLRREQQELGDITGESFDNTFNSNSLTNGSQSTKNSNENVHNTGISLNQNQSSYEALATLDQQMNEPEKIRKWREEFAARITKKDADEEVKRKEMREQAKKELDDFHKQRIEQMERMKEQNRLNNRTLEDSLFKNGNSSTFNSNGKVYDWDKITSLCEFNPKNNRSQKDLSRYRSVLLQLKQQQTVGK